MSDLILHIKSIWFDKIKSGEKTEEYRETKPYWKKRLEGKSFDRLILVRGNYGNERDLKNVMIFPYLGYIIKQVGSWEKQEMVEVFALKLERDTP